MFYRLRFFALIALLGLAAPALAAGVAGTLYKTPGCGCCEEHAKYLREHGYDITVVPHHDLAQLRAAHGVPEHLAGCHLIELGGYIFEGHMPAASIARVLREKPAIKGLSVPGMPPGSPGMTGVKQEPLRVYYISDQMPPRLYETH